MFGWIVLGLVAAGGATVAFLRKQNVVAPKTKRTLAEIVRNEDSVFVPILAVQPGFQSDTINAELAAIKAANVGKETLRIDDVFLDANGKGGARGVITGTPFAPTTRVRFLTKDVVRIERPNDNNPEGFDVIATDLVT